MGIFIVFGIGYYILFISFVYEQIFEERWHFWLSILPGGMVILYIIIMFPDMWKAIKKFFRNFGRYVWGK